MDYSIDIQKIFTLGTQGLDEKGIDYQELGLEFIDSDELVLVALDETLHYNDNIDGASLYAPIHAIKALTQFKYEKAFDPIAHLISQYEDDDYLADALISYAKVLDRVDNIKSMITNNSLSELASDTLYKALHKEELQAEEEARIKAENEAKANAEKEARIKAENEAKANAEEEARIKAENEAKAEEIPLEESEPVTIKDVQPVASYGKVGRNEPCPCGSGNKYKKCCMNN